MAKLGAMKDLAVKCETVRLLCDQNVKSVNAGRLNLFLVTLRRVSYSVRETLHPVLWAPSQLRGSAPMDLNRNTARDAPRVNPTSGRCHSVLGRHGSVCSCILKCQTW